MKYRFKAVVTISISTVVEAESEEQAKEIAMDRPMCNLGEPRRHGCTDEDSWVHSGEIDGEPQEIEVEKQP
jgi:hypothetical protein